MLVILPVFFLTFGALGILVLQRTKPGFSYAWLIAVSLTLITWLYFLVIRWFVIQPLIIPGWFSITSVDIFLEFLIDEASLPYAFCLVSLLLAVLLTDPARLSHSYPDWTLAGLLAVTCSGLLAILAGNPTTMILAWTTIDIIELLFILGGNIQGKLNQEVILSFAARVLGSFVVLWAMAGRQSDHAMMTFEAVTPEVGLSLLLAAGLRLGVVPLYIPFAREIPLRRGLGTMLRLVAPASSLVMLARLPNLVMPFNWAFLLSAFTALAAIFGAAMWLSSDDEISGRPYWVISLAGMAVACVVRVQSSASIAWGVALLVTGGVLFLYSARQQRIIFIPFLALLGLTGLPFTPAVSGWKGLLVYPINILDFLFMIAHVLLLLGFLRHTLRSQDSFNELDRWIKAVYPLGLMILILSQWITSFGMGAETLPAGVWWGGLLSFFLFITVMVVYSRLLNNQSNFQWIEYLSRSTGKYAVELFSLRWFYRIIWWFYGIIQRLVVFISTILEGDGGVMWALLLLTLLYSILQAGGVQ